MCNYIPVNIFKTTKNTKLLLLASAEKLFLILGRYGSALWIPFSKSKNEVYFSNTKNMPKETLKYLITLIKSQKEFKFINLDCNNDFTMVISQYFKTLLECLPSSPKDFSL